jgi:glycosyltransferase involved in cell wall biosynthesis
MKLAPGTNWRAVQNGIPTYKYTFNSKPIAERERLLFVSRMYLPKGVHRAIEIANMMKMPIDIVGGSFGDLSNYTEQIKKMCEQSQYGAKFHGEVSFAKKLEFYMSAKCVILPIIEYGMTDAQGKPWEWHEPFGLVTSEAGACGTPTIVTPNGGWNESMMHGFNGYFANTNEEFCYYLKRINEIKPENCRWAAERFDYKIMGENYLKLFKEIIESGGW